MKRKHCSSRLWMLLISMSMTLWMHCKVFILTPKEEANIVTNDTIRHYKFLNNIAYEETNKKHSLIIQDKNHHNLKNKSKAFSKNLVSAQRKEKKKRQSYVQMKGNIITIDTFHQHLIVDNKENNTIDTVIITNTRLFNAILSWLGTRYKYGGNSRENIDCSALTRALILTTYNKNVPRTSIEQYRTVSPIGKEHLQEGNLVFFDINKQKRVSHVGLYLANQYFIHAGTSSGVTLSSLETPYWKNRIIGYGNYKFTHTLAQKADQ